MSLALFYTPLPKSHSCKSFLCMVLILRFAIFTSSRYPIFEVAICQCLKRRASDQYDEIAIAKLAIQSVSHGILPSASLRRKRVPGVQGSLCSVNISYSCSRHRH